MFFSSKIKFLLAVITVLATLIVAIPASGKDAKVVSPRGERAKGMVALNLGRYEEAALHLEAAYAWHQDPLILFSLGQAYRLSGNYNKAIASFNAFLRSAGPMPKYRSKIDRAATEIELIASTQFRPTTSPSTNLDLDHFGLNLEDPATEDPTTKQIEPMPLDPVIADQDEPKTNPDPPKTNLMPTTDQLATTTPVTETPAGLNLSNHNNDDPKPVAKKSVLKNWWFWSGVATVAAMGGAATWYLSRPGTETPSTSLGSIRVYQ